MELKRWIFIDKWNRNTSLKLKNKIQIQNHLFHQNSNPLQKTALINSNFLLYKSLQSIMSTISRKIFSNTLLIFIIFNTKRINLIKASKGKKNLILIHLILGNHSNYRRFVFHHKNNKIKMNTLNILDLLLMLKPLIIVT